MRESNRCCSPRNGSATPGADESQACFRVNYLRSAFSGTFWKGKIMSMIASSHVLGKQSRKLPSPSALDVECLNYSNKPKHLSLHWLLNDSLWYEKLPYSGELGSNFQNSISQSFLLYSCLWYHTIVKALVDFLATRVGRLIASLFKGIYLDKRS